jgi:hypothetical protein
MLGLVVIGRGIKREIARGLFSQARHALLAMPCGDFPVVMYS